MEEKRDNPVSVIVPVYNAEKYIGRCLDSLLQQTFTNIEIVVINDGSVDSSRAIIEKYAAKDERIHLLCQENKGVSAARNKGIENASGKYIMFADSDDYVADTYVADFVNTMESTKADIAVCGYYECYEKKSRQIEKSYFKDNSSFENYRQAMLKNPIDNYFSVLWNKCFLRGHIVNNNLLFEEGRSFAEDYAFLINYIKAYNKMAFVENCNYYYLFDREGSLGKGNDNRSRRVEDISFVYKKYKEFWEHFDLYNKKKKKIQFYAMKLYFEEMKFYKEATQEETVFLEKRLLLENGLTPFDIAFFKFLREIKHIIFGKGD